jgi:hypothetical protein
VFNEFQRQSYIVDIVNDEYIRVVHVQSRRNPEVQFAAFSLAGTGG